MQTLASMQGRVKRELGCMQGGGQHGVTSTSSTMHSCGRENTRLECDARLSRFVRSGNAMAMRDDNNWMQRRRRISPDVRHACMGCCMSRLMNADARACVVLLETARAEWAPKTHWAPCACGSAERPCKAVVAQTYRCCRHIAIARAPCAMAAHHACLSAVKTWHVRLATAPCGRFLPTRTSALRCGRLLNLITTTHKTGRTKAQKLQQCIARQRGDLDFQNTRPRCVAACALGESGVACQAHQVTTTPPIGAHVLRLSLSTIDVSCAHSSFACAR